ncbi:hypothetical protein HMPREF0497_1283 [Lentilactobacillus buchneri ATCC 11577]|uniref:Uncharacterized protein n=1 Tax=Lentilactobacillus hilgardii (strain ATCC 8290 / DSM 20176 / CCUG 30140 / JCM 1155 / KCTC 3500 / NBRC 15886 / NCIMB 8040 / NRRL B-1843 / 9) TaxID=1423757 RepID=C0XKQ7_LENH9|nr:hypothetical protein HMPREF0497_1283 [Lentilactobacillus buchneri ATCC 11577]EEI24052.1 hypothetical protein HMPREF0519_1818 [Lentilactobacillus hilgardii DSM 20176 = ATCC 8290]
MIIVKSRGQNIFVLFAAFFGLQWKNSVVLKKYGKLIEAESERLKKNDKYFLR